jgi:hypothetical protein
MSQSSWTQDPGDLRGENWLSLVRYACENDGLDGCYRASASSRLHLQREAIDRLLTLILHPPPIPMPPMPPIPPAAAVEEVMPAMPVSVGDISMPALVGVAIAMLAEVIMSIADDMDISIVIFARLWKRLV